jgi:hypothetical protein
MSRDEYCFEGLKNLVNTFHMIADGFSFFGLLSWGRKVNKKNQM